MCILTTHQKPSLMSDDMVHLKGRPEHHVVHEDSGTDPSRLRGVVALRAELELFLQLLCPECFHRTTRDEHKVRSECIATNYGKQGLQKCPYSHGLNHTPQLYKSCLDLASTVPPRRKIARYSQGFCQPTQCSN